MMALKNYGNVLWFCPMHLLPHSMSFNGVVFRSSAGEDITTVTFLFDMRAAVLILFLNFTLSHAKRGALFLHSVNHASRDDL